MEIKGVSLDRLIKATTIKQTRFAVCRRGVSVFGSIVPLALQLTSKRKRDHTVNYCHTFGARIKTLLKLARQESTEPLASAANRGPATLVFNLFSGFFPNLLLHQIKATVEFNVLTSKTSKTNTGRVLF